MNGYAVTASSKSAMIGTSRGLARARKSKMYKEDRLMKRTFKQRIKDWLFAETPNQIMEANYVEESRELDTRNSTRFTVHPASGGTVIQTRTYDERKDRHVENLYIIHRSEDLGEELAKIITLEGLRT
jgi:hypothetical protein